LLHLPRTNSHNTQSETKGNGEQSVSVQPADSDGNDIDNGAISNSTHTSVNAHARQEGRVGQVLLSTAEILVYDNTNKPVWCRALLDSGSQHNFMTESMTRRLNLKRMNASCAIIGINDASHVSTFKVAATIKSRVHDY